jgi:hypothetical protein
MYRPSMGAGVSQPNDEALLQLRAVSSATLSGLFDTQMGRGIVGGPLLPMWRGAEEQPRPRSGFRAATPLE